MRVLLLPYEHDVYNFVEFGKKMIQDGHEVHILVSDFFSVLTGRGYVKNAFLEAGFPEDSVVDLDAEIKQINQYSEKEKLNFDYRYLRQIESQFVTGRGLNHLIYADIYLSRMLHNRDYNFQSGENKELVYLFLELVAKKVDKILKGFKPDLIFTFGSYNLVRNLTYEFSQMYGIRFYSLFLARVNDISLMSENLFLGAQQEVLAEIEKLRVTGQIGNTAKDFVHKIKAKNEPAYDSTIFYNAKDLEGCFSFSNQIRPVLRNALSLPRAFLKDKEVRYRGAFKSNYFYIKSVFYMWYYNFRNAFRVRAYFKSKELNTKVLPEGKFVFYSLQSIPEDGVFTQPTLADELQNIIRLSKVVPADYKIVVKAHFVMLNIFSDAYPVDWYESIARIHNVVVVSPLMTGVQIIRQAEAVASANSTTLFEGAIMGKPVFRFGRAEFECLDGVFEFQEKTFLNNLLNYKLSPNNNHELYIQAVMNVGIDIEFSRYGYMTKDQTSDENFKNKFVSIIVNKLYELYRGPNMSGHHRII